MSTLPLYRLARVIRSKNAKPYLLTLDVIFNNEDLFEYVKQKNALTKEAVLQAYNLPEESFVSSFIFDEGLAFKFTIKRPIAQGSPGDSDIYGAQQHVPLMYIEIPWEEGLDNSKLLPDFNS